VRALVLALLLINMLFFGWSHWIDKPAAGQQRAAGVSALQLAPEAVASPTTAVATGAPPPAIPGAAAAAPAAANSAVRCATLGPIADRAAASAVITALQARNLSPQLREAKAEAADGYWVYIDNLRDAAARTRALKLLARAGVRDAAALASSGQVSVGLFNEKSGADLRAAAVRSAGLEPVIEARTRPVSEYWFDVNLANDIPLPAVSALIAGLGIPADPAWRACPASGAGPAAAR
jgi:hypothetical protein